jgi:hypothetical protein
MIDLQAVVSQAAWALIAAFVTVGNTSGGWGGADWIGGGRARSGGWWVEEDGEGGGEGGGTDGGGNWRWVGRARR